MVIVRKAKPFLLLFDEYLGGRRQATGAAPLYHQTKTIKVSWFARITIRYITVSVERVGQSVLLCFGTSGSGASASALSRARSD